MSEADPVRTTIDLILTQKGVTDPTDREVVLLTRALEVGVMTSISMSRKAHRKGFWLGMVLGVGLSMLAAILGYVGRVT